MPPYKNALPQMQQGVQKAWQTAFRFFPPDYTVGPGFTPDQRPLCGRSRAYGFAPLTAGGELHPALKQTFCL